MISTLASTIAELDESQWARIAPLMPAIRRYGDEPPRDQRTIVAGILWVARTGSRWRDLPACFGYWETIHAYYHRWKQHGSWAPILAALQAPPDTAPG